MTITKTTVAFDCRTLNINLKTLIDCYSLSRQL